MIKSKIVLFFELIFILVPMVQPKKPEKPEEMVEAAGHRVIAYAEENFEEATDDWNLMQERLDQAIRNGKGQNVNFLAGNRFTVPEGLLQKLSGKNATLGLHTSNGVTFSVSGRDVKAVDKPVSMEVIYEPVIPEEAIGQLQGYQIVKQFCMTEKDSYPCPVNVHMALGKENAGKHAVLYSYDEGSGCMRQEETWRVTGDGHAIFGLNRGDEYAVVLMEGYIAKAGDTFSHIAVRHGVSVGQLQAVNPQIINIDRIRIGQQVNIPHI